MSLHPNRSPGTALTGSDVDTGLPGLAFPDSAAPPFRRPEFLLFSPPSIGEEEINEVAAALRSGWISTGPRTRRFETEFAARLSAPAALGLNSCTAGLHTALVTMGLQPGDEVITTPMTFAASVNVIEHCRGTPVLVDIEPDTMNIDPELIERAITPRTKAIIPVHFAGHPVELDPIYDLAQRYGLTVIEDAAHALPARYRGRWIGSRGNPVSFSFYATKNLTTGEGGMLAGEPDFLARARVVSLHGMSRDAWQRYGSGGSWFYEVEAPGFKYNMTDIQAALGLVQLRRLDQFQAVRRRVVAAYAAAFGNHPAFQIPVERPWVEHAWQLYVLRLRPEALRIDRARFIEELTACNVGTSVHFIPIHLHPYYRRTYGYAPEDYPVAHDCYRRTISIPLHPGLTDADVGDVITAVLDVARRFRR